MECQATGNINMELGEGSVGDAVSRPIAKSSRTTDNDSKIYHFEYMKKNFFWHKFYDSIWHI